jgi:hypothetical protein
MARTTTQTKTPATPGFAIEIKEDTELGLAILVAEFGAGNYQPVGVVVSINEAREIADSDMRGRIHDVDRGKTPGCPGRYLVWAQGLEGEVHHPSHDRAVSTQAPPKKAEQIPCLTPDRSRPGSRRAYCRYHHAGERAAR